MLLLMMRIWRSAAAIDFLKEDAFDSCPLSVAKNLLGLNSNSDAHHHAELYRTWL